MEVTEYKALEAGDWDLEATHTTSRGKGAGGAPPLQRLKRGITFPEKRSRSGTFPSPIQAGGEPESEAEFESRRV